MEKVAVVKCSDYDEKKVFDAVKKSFELIGFSPKESAKVLIKPNIVGGYPKNQEAITTHLSVIRGVCEFLRQKNCEILIGDSSFVNTSQHMKTLGIDKLAEEYGKLVIFEKEKLLEFKDENSEFVESVKLPGLFREIDYIINLPKLKTHVLTLFSGAVKNMYGCIPGGMKQVYHNTARGYENFSRLVVDIFQKVIPSVNLMDGIIGMEGPGSTAGEPKKAGILLASKNAFALDIAGCKIISINPEEVAMLKEGIKRNLYSEWKFDLVGVEKLPEIKFKKPHEKEMQEGLAKVFPERDVLVNREKCIKCGICTKRCPVNAITMNPYPMIDYKKCIRCFCCAEVCPQHAMEIQSPQSIMGDNKKEDD